MIKPKNMINILSLLIILAPSTGAAQNWKSIGATSVAKFYLDADRLVGDQENRKLVVKINYAEERKDGTKSVLQEISVNCIERVYSTDTIKTYILADLQGSEKIGAVTGKKIIPVQGSVGEDYIKRACESTPKNPGANTNLYPADSTSQTQINGQRQQINRLQFFGKSNTLKNLQDAFSNLMTDDQRDDIALNFIFANNIVLKLTKSESFKREGLIYAPVLPKMQQGVERYLRSFDNLANVLGVSRANVMQAFNLNMNDFGLATIAINRNYNIESQMNMYIWYFGGTKDGVQLARDLNPYYKQRPPELYYTSIINDEIKKIELVSQRVLDNAINIENQLSAMEVEREKREREAVIRRESELRRIAEEKQKREDYLNSPEGQRQMASERKARELAEEMARPKPINRKNIVKGVEYTYYGDSKCANVGDTVCLVPADYEYLCKMSKGMTVLAASVLTMYDPAASHLVTNGTTDSSEVTWEGSSSYKFKCRATVSVSGIYKGSSRRATASGGVTKFVVNKSNEVLVHHASSSH